MSKRILLGFFLFLITASSLLAQKKKLAVSDYDQWQYTTATSLSPNGQWFAYNIELVDGDGWLMIKKAGSDSTREHKFPHGVQPAFSENSRWVAFKIGVSDDKREQMNEQQQPVQYKLALMNLETAETDTLGHINDFSFSDNGRYLAMHKYKAEGASNDGADLILRELQTGTNQLFGNVAEYAFNDEGSLLALRLEASEKLGNGVHLYNPPERSITVLDSDTTDYTHLEWSEEGAALAFMKARSDEDFKDDTYLVYSYTNLERNTEKTIFDQRSAPAFPDSFRVVAHRAPYWSEDRERLFFGIKKWASKEKASADSSAVDSDSTMTEQPDQDDDLDPTNVEIWHWKDTDIQPRQKITATMDQQKNYLSAWHINDQTFVQLADEEIEDVMLTGDQEHAIGLDPTPYEPAFEEDWNDIYVIDVATGNRKKILEKHEGVRPSPAGKYLIYFKDQNWWTYHMDDERHTNLTENIDARFENFTYTTGRTNYRPFGRGQWQENDDWVLLYDQYDIYRAQPDGKGIKKLTNGRPEKIRYRHEWIRTQDPYIKKNQDVLFSMYGDTTKMHGYARWDDEVTTLIYEPALILRLNKAEDAQRYVYQKETASDSPDYYWVSSSFEDPIALTRTNRQQEDYFWGRDSLINYTNKRGEELQGRLIYPANYEPGKQYPMITYIYEKLSQTMHRYLVPTPKSAYNAQRYSSEGYFVLQPDITYELSDPGMSAVASVVPAVEEVLATGMVNEDQVGLTGHSWGAYQTTFIITQTDVFNSAVAGAPLTNMISMYNSIYWNAGITNANIFETSQGRFPDPWWKDRQKFVENSTIFNLETMDTPLLVEFGTNDGAVDFNQGVELYNTMRRMQKPFVMLVYEGENHGLAREENQIDYATRAFEWHEHFLLGKKAADWITEGLPYIERPEMQDK